jgi:hypothetical protein
VRDRNECNKSQSLNDAFHNILLDTDKCAPLQCSVVRTFEAAHLSFPGPDLVSRGAASMAHILSIESVSRVLITMQKFCEIFTSFGGSLNSLSSKLLALNDRMYAQRY